MIKIKSERRSRQREHIIEYIKGTKIHPTADEVYENIKADIPNISLGTVYRNLALLSEEKKITKVMNVKGTDHYDGNTVNHYHFLCNNCGRIYDLEMDILPLESIVNEKTSHKAKNHEVNFTGICLKCTAREENI